MFICKRITFFDEASLLVKNHSNFELFSNSSSSQPKDVHCRPQVSPHLSILCVSNPANSVFLLPDHRSILQEAFPRGIYYLFCEQYALPVVSLLLDFNTSARFRQFGLLAPQSTDCIQRNKIVTLDLRCKVLVYPDLVLRRLK